YHQFLTSVEFGVKRDRATLRALRMLPIPLAEHNRTDLQRWVALYNRLSRIQPRQLHEPFFPATSQMSLFSPDEDDDLQPLLHELNSMVYDSLGVDAR